jgi:hypothetical protein
MYVLISENLTGLGSAMGTEHTWENFRVYFNNKKKALKCAEADYRKQTRNPSARLEWVPGNKPGDLRTPDLRFVMYHLRMIVPADRRTEGGE